MSEGDTGVGAVAAAIEQEQLPWTAAENELTALSSEEQTRYLGVIVTTQEMAQLAAETQQAASREMQLIGAFAAPAAVDWRSMSGQNYVSPVKNQGQCGSCVSFCSCATIESAIKIKLKNPGYAIDLSEGFLQFCGGGSCGGWGLTSGLDYAKSTGVVDDACMPYAAPPDMNCAASRCSDWQNRLTKITSYTGYATADARKNAIATIGPVLAGMAVYSDFYAYSSGVYVKTSSAVLKGYHCICCVGYDDADQCWILKNSWGTSYGQGGFVKVRYGQPDLLIDSQWMMYSVVPVVGPAWSSNVAVLQAYASRDAQNAWAYFQNLGWRRIQTGAADGVTNMLALFAEAVTKSRPVTIYADGDFVYQAYLS